MGVEEYLDEKLIDLGGIVDDLVVAAASGCVGWSQLQAIQRALARKRTASVPLALATRTRDVVLANQRGQQRVAAQFIVVIEVFLAVGKSVDPLRQ